VNMPETIFSIPILFERQETRPSFSLSPYRCSSGDRVVHNHSKNLLTSAFSDNIITDINGWSKVIIHNLSQHVRLCAYKQEFGLFTTTADIVPNQSVTIFASL
jgi:hypothetical protein